MQEFEEDFYAILGVTESATPEEVRKAYLKLAKRLHPDRYPNDAEARAAAQTEFAKVTRAHEVISDEGRRNEYDAIRALSKARGGGTGASLEALLQNTGGNHKSMDTVAGADPPTPVDQTQTVADQEGMNIKWANKHLQRADDLFKKKRFQEAETAMKEAIRLVPGDPKYRNKLAEVYLARGWKTLAKTEVQAALRIDPKDLDAKSLEQKIKQAERSQSTTQLTKGKANIMDQIKNLFSKKAK